MWNGIFPDVLILFFSLKEAFNNSGKLRIDMTGLFLSL